MDHCTRSIRARSVYRKSEAEQDVAPDEPHRIAANIAKLPELRGTVTERPVPLVGSRNQAGG